MFNHMYTDHIKSLSIGVVTTPEDYHMLFRDCYLKKAYKNNYEREFFIRLEGALWV